MASNITYSTIDENYPVPGVDNDSQGFRDNFNVVKTALTTANTEITNLQSGSCKVNAANNFAGNTISYASFLANKESTNTANRTGVSVDLLNTLAALLLIVRVSLTAFLAIVIPVPSIKCTTLPAPPVLSANVIVLKESSEPFAEVNV